ncbi:MAG: hypothetical protein ACP5OA_01720 [Candidatus Woesearchaeota archaeon]
MVNQQLVDWIRNQISQKISSEQIREILITKGYNTDDVNEAINIVLQEQTRQQVNNPNKKRVFTILIICILSIIVIVCGVLWFTNNNNKDSHESYFEYINKQKNLQTYSVAYDVKLPIMHALSGTDIDDKKITLEVYKEGYNEKRVVEFNESGKTNTFSYFNINGTHTNCWKNSNGAISCNIKNGSEEELRRTTPTIPDDISKLLDNTNMIYKGKDTINNMNCALFRLDIDNIDKFMDATYSLTQGISAGSGTPGTLEVCVDEETGIISSMKLSSTIKSSFKENIILEYNILSFSNIVAEDAFLLSH